jgi:paraquat-inducible protein B
MAKQANRMMIGGFVVFGVTLLVASIVIFGSGRFFKQTDKYVLHFDGSIMGLNVGAPVLFQGVQIGAVTSIVLRADRKKMTLDIPVVIQIEPDRFQVVDELDKRSDPEEILPILIDKGLRAVLTMQSFITGQLLVELDFYPDTRAVLKETDADYPEIPTIPSATKRLTQTLQNIDFEGMAKHLEETMTGVDRFINNPDLTEGISSLKLTIEESRQLIGKINSNIDSIVANLDGTLADARTLINKADQHVDPLAGDLKKTLADFDMLAQNADAKLAKVMTNLDESLAGVRETLSGDSQLVIMLEDTLRDVSAMAKYLRQLADYLERHPEALLQGKEEQGGN